MSETAPDLCAARCPRGHDHTCARSPKHCGFHRDVKQKGNESCSWTDDDRPTVGPVYESPEELAAEIVRLREESVRVGRCGAESRRLYPDGRAEPTFCALPAGHAGWHRDDSGTTEWNDPEPSPRDGDLTRTLRDAMRRYGVPAVMAEAGRLAQQRL